jgi:hypothetical protein
MIVEIGGSKRHDEISETNKWTVFVRKQAYNNVTIEDGHCGLIPIKDAFFNTATRAPVKHSG